MKRMDVTDEWLYEKMPAVDEELIKELEERTDYEYQFSERFEKRMEKMIRKEKKRRQRGRFRYLRTVAAAVFIIICMSPATALVYAEGIHFFETVKTELKDRFIYSYSTKKDSEKMDVKKPGYVPSRYELEGSKANGILSDYVYKNETGEKLVFVQMLVTDKNELIIDSEYDQKEQIEFMGKMIDVHRYKNGYAHCYLEFRD